MQHLGAEHSLEAREPEVCDERRSIAAGDLCGATEVPVALAEAVAPERATRGGRAEAVGLQAGERFVAGDDALADVTLALAAEPKG